jgi:hypothetical protein
MLHEVGLLKVPYLHKAVPICCKLLLTWGKCGYYKQCVFVPTALGLVGTCFMDNLMQKPSQTLGLQTSNFFSLFTDMTAMNARPKCMFKARVVKVIDEILDIHEISINVHCLLHDICTALSSRVTAYLMVTAVLLYILVIWVHPCQRTTQLGSIISQKTWFLYTTYLQVLMMM